MHADADVITKALLAWYDANRRVLPWRAAPGAPSDPYRVWVSEIMLQQTTVATVGPYFADFLAHWPDVRALAGATQEEVLSVWAGLGYYSRARNLHRTAQIVVHERGGRFPASAAELRELPGIGDYTAAAIAAIAWAEQVAALDANAKRVIARLFAVTEMLPKAKAELAKHAEALVPAGRPGDFAQALMDLGSAICVPKRPVCPGCPLAADCRGRRMGLVAQLPRNAPKRARPLKRGAAFVAFDRKGAVYLVRRPEKGLLGAMLQPPLSEWADDFPDHAAAIGKAPFAADWVLRSGCVRHGFTHFVLELEVWVARCDSRPKSRKGQGIWLDSAEIGTSALPTLMRKVIAHAGAELYHRMRADASTPVQRAHLARS